MLKFIYLAHHVMLGCKMLYHLWKKEVCIEPLRDFSRYGMAVDDENEPE